VPRHVVEEGEFDSEGGEEEHGVLLAPMRVVRMRMNSSSLFFSKGYVGCLVGCSWVVVWAALVDSCWAGPAGKVQVSLLSYFPFLFLFSVLYLQFEFHI
jgi:hypothetical protein